MTEQMGREMQAGDSPTSSRVPLRENFVLRTITRRLGLGAITLFLVSVLVFAATQLLPGDAAQAVLGKNATPEALAALRERLGLGVGPLQQYWLWLQSFLSGDAGDSLANQQPVWAQVGPRIRNSLWLVCISAVIGIPIAIALGIWSAVRRDTIIDHSTAFLALVAAAVPEFVIAIVLILVFSTTVLHVLPPVSLVPPGGSILDDPAILVLPVATLVIVIVPYVMRMTRSAMAEVLTSEYVEMARLKGMSPARILMRHAFPNALPPIVQAVALNLAYLAGGIVVVEFVFGFPGVGQGLVHAINARDIPTIQLIIMLLASVYIVLSILADVCVVLVTPRLRTSTWHH